MARGKKCGYNILKNSNNCRKTVRHRVHSRPWVSQANKRIAPQMIVINCCQEKYGEYVVDTTVDFILRKPNSLIMVDTTNNPVTITLGNNLANQENIYIVDTGGNASNNNITINGNGDLINGAATRVLNQDYQATSMVRTSPAGFAATDTIQAGGGGSDGNAAGSLIDVALDLPFSTLYGGIATAGDIVIDAAALLTASPSVIVSGGDFYITSVSPENLRLIDTLTINYIYDDATDPAETYIGGIDLVSPGKVNEVVLYPKPVDGASTTLLRMIDNDDPALTATSLNNLDFGGINTLYTGGLGIDPPHAPGNVGETYSDYVSFIYDPISALFNQSDDKITHS